MKGDFSNIIQGDGYDALLVQQGRPLLDLQINGIGETLLRAQERMISELIAKIKFPQPISNNQDSIKFPSNVIYVDGIRAVIKNLVDDNGSFKVTIDGNPKKLLGTEIAAGDYTLFVEVYEETLSHSTEAMFADTAVPSGNSLRLIRWAELGVADDANWKALQESHAAKAPLTLKTDQELGNYLKRFEIISIDSMKDIKNPGNEQKTKIYIKYSRNNGGFVLPIKRKLEEEKEADRKQKIVGQKVFVDGPTFSATGILEAGQFVEFESLDNTGTSRSFGISEITEVGNGYVEVKKIPDRVEDKTDLMVLRIWDYAGPLDDNEKEKILYAKLKHGFTISFAKEKKSTLKIGDFWTVTTREPNRDYSADRQARSIKLEKIWTVQIGQNEDGFTIQKLVSSHLFPQTDSQPILLSREATISSRISQSPPPTVADFTLSDTPCLSLIKSINSKAVSQWLASLCYGEIVNRSKDELRSRIKRDCNEKDYDADSLEADLEMIAARCKELNKTTQQFA